MSQSDRRMCLDLAVKRGAECNTDHQFVCVCVCEDQACRWVSQKEGDGGQ